MAIPYEKNVILTPGNTTPTFALAAPPRGILERFIVSQQGGASDGYSYNLYSIDPANVPSGQNIASYKIIPTQTVAGSSTTSELFNQAAPYRNVTKELLPTQPISVTCFVYLVMSITTGVTSKKFQVGYAITSDMH